MASVTTSQTKGGAEGDSKRGVNEVHKSNDKHQDDQTYAKLFRKLWLKVTDDNSLTLHGFRRFKTTHLVNLRFLEEEIHKVDHEIYQAGLKFGFEATSVDKLGLRHATRDASALGAEEVISSTLIVKLRALIRQYGRVSLEGPNGDCLHLRLTLSIDEALIAFNNIMLMETYVLADSRQDTSLWTGLNAHEAFKTRHVRVDQAHRSGSRDVLRHCLRKCLRAFWFHLRYGGNRASNPRAFVSASKLESNLKKSSQNTAALAEVITRFLVALLAGAFLVVPLIVLSHQSSSKTQLVTISICIVIFSFLVSLLSRASNEQTMAASAGYAAVLVVFLSNSSNNPA